MRKCPVTIPIFSASLFIPCVCAFVIVYLLFICNLFLFIFSSLHLYSIYFIFLFISWHILNSCCFLVSYWLFSHTCFFLLHFHSVLVLSSDDKYRILSKHVALFSFLMVLLRNFLFYCPLQHFIQHLTILCIDSTNNVTVSKIL